MRVRWVVERTVGLDRRVVVVRLTFPFDLRLVVFFVDLRFVVVFVFDFVTPRFCPLEDPDVLTRWAWASDGIMTRLAEPAKVTRRKRIAVLVIE